ncbi:MAG: SOS response-associated peptidase [Halobacteriales archaeon]
MCGRTSLFAPPPAVEDRFDVSVEGDLPPRYNVGPGDWLATVPDAAPHRLSRLSWGLVPRWAEDPDAGPRPINARRETLAEAAPFRGPYRDRRCLVVVDGYYEWVDAPGGRQPIRFERRDREPFALAGVWDRWSNGTDRETVAVVTAEAAPAVRDVHDRMPVILSREAAAGWLDSAPVDPSRSAVLDPAYDDAFHRYPVDPKMNDGTVDDPSVVAPIGEGGQRTLGDY